MWLEAFFSPFADPPRSINIKELVVDTSRTESRTDLRRRRFLAVTAMTSAAAQFGFTASTSVQAAKPKLPHIKPGTNVSFAPLKQIDAGVLRVAYAEAGPSSGPPVVLLHGWPY